MLPRESQCLFQTRIHLQSIAANPRVEPLGTRLGYPAQCRKQPRRRTVAFARQTKPAALFLPQMFGRMNQYTKELALGPLQQLTLGVEGGQWHVIKCPNIYFAALGRRGEPLPLNLLAQIAAELSSQSN